MSWLRNRAGDERGAVFVFVAAAMVVLVGSAALAVDIGQLTNTRRDLQKVADAVALDSARAVNGSTHSVLMHPVTGPVLLAAQASAARNNFPFNLLEVKVGTKSGTDPFVEMTAGSDIPTAVQVIARETVDFAFAPGSSSTSRQAVATQDATVDFSVGSYLASISSGQSALFNSVLGGILGQSFGVNVLSYDGLVNANTTLEAIGLHFPLGVMTPDELLTTDVSASNLFIASAEALRAGGNTAAAGVLDAMALTAGPAMVNLGDFIKAGTGGSGAGANGQINVLQMLTAAAFVADGTHAINIPSTALNIPGVGGVDVALTVVSPLEIVRGARVNDFGETSQLSLTVTPQIAISTNSGQFNGCSLQSTLGSLLSLSLSETTTCLLGGFVGRVIALNLNASIPISLEAAKARATLTNITCSAPQSITLTPELQTLRLASNVDLTFTGTLLGKSLGEILRVRGAGNVTTQTTAPPQFFLNPSEFGIPKTIGSNPLGLAGLTNFTSSKVSLLRADLSPVLSALTPPVLSAVNTVLGQLDSVLMGPLNDILGLNVGGADLTALTDSLNCKGVKLVE